MSYRLAWCPQCNFTWNFYEPIPEYDPLRATTAVKYRDRCPRCGCVAFIYSHFKVLKEER